MSKTVVGLFDDFSQAQRAVQDLEQLGIARNDISLVANNSSGQHDHYMDNSRVYDNTTNAVSTDAGIGATTGAVLGGGLGLIAGLGMLAIPGFGPVIAAGWLVATLTGAGIGAAAGGLLGALVGAGVPHEEAQLYNEGVRRGGTLIAVKAADDMADQVADVLSRYDAVDIDERAESYRQPYDLPAPATTPSTANWSAPANSTASNTSPGFVPFEPTETEHTPRNADSTGIKTGGHDLDGSPDTRGITEKMADAVTGDRIDDKTGKPVG